MAKLQYTHPTLGNFIVLNDYRVLKNGTIDSVAVADSYDGTTRLSCHGDTIIQANPVPHLGIARVVREPGWLGALGYRVTLIEYNATPNAIGFAIYGSPGGVDYQYTTGSMLWDGSEWYCTCPAGFEPGDTDIHMGFLYGATRISAFTLPAGRSEGYFLGGGDY